MAIFSGFICEKCNKEFRKGEKDYSPVTIQISVCLGKEAPSLYATIKEHVIWCKKCVMKTGFSEPITENDKEIAPKRILTFEEKFIELIEDLGFVTEL